MKRANKIKKEENYIQLYSYVENFCEQMLPQYKRELKGTDYNGAYGDYNETSVVINSEDYRIMDDVVERYNAIIGRAEIMRDLMKKAGI